MKKVFSFLALLLACVIFASCQGEKQTVDYYQIGFNTNGGSAIETLELKENDDIVMPSNPEKAGMAFAGWYKDEELTEKFVNPGKMPAESFWLFAAWTCDYYQIGFQTNGGTEMENLKVAADADLVMPENPTKEGMLFAGWYRDIALKEAFINPGKMPAESFWLFADWKVSLTFDSMGGSECETIINHPNKFIENVPTPTNGNNIFQGWYLDKEYTQKLGLVMPKENTTVYARWQAVEETTAIDLLDSIKLNGNGFYTLDKEADGYKVTATANKGSWDYFYFTIDYNVKSYSMFEIVLEGKKDAKYMTKLESGGATATEVARVLTGEEEKIYWHVKEANLTATGGEKFIIFLNYGNSGCDATNPEWIKIKSIKLYRTTDLGATELQGLFFNSLGGNIVEPIFAPLDSQITAPKNPTKPGYEFLGWYEDVACTREFTFDKMPQGPKTLYAGWDINDDITINFETNGGSKVDPLIVSKGSSVNTLPQPEYAGKLFAGWYTDSAFSQKFTSKTYEQSMTLYALFVDYETGLENPITFINGWVDTDGLNGYIIVNENNILDVTTTETKGSWATIKTMITPTEGTHNVLRVNLCGTEGQNIIIKLRLESGKDVEYKITLSEIPQTYYYVLPEKVMYSYNALIFVDGGKTGAQVSGTHLTIYDLALCEVIGSEAKPTEPVKPGVTPIDATIDTSKYQLLEFAAGIGYYNSTAKGDLSKAFQTNQKFYIGNTIRFTKEDIPVGSIILTSENWQYRPDGWTGDIGNTLGRPSETQVHKVVVDEAWWSEFIYRGFNISKNPKVALTEDDLANINNNFQIWVPIK